MTFKDDDTLVEGIYQPHQILSWSFKYSWICGHLNVTIFAIIIILIKPAVLQIL